jgi:hypothetical protein
MPVAQRRAASAKLHAEADVDVAGDKEDREDESVRRSGDWS